jgi:hypothetical protein
MNVAVITLLMMTLFLCAFVGLDMAIRPARYTGGQWAFSALLDSVVQKGFPGLDRASAYRVIGAVVAVSTLVAASLVAMSSLAPFATGGQS